MTDRERFPDARYRALDNPGTRIRDERTGQEVLNRVVGVEDLVDERVSVDELADSDRRVVEYVEISPNNGPGEDWVAKISSARLDVRTGEHDEIRLISTANAVQSGSFDDRDDAVAWAERAAGAFEAAPIVRVGEVEDDW